MMNNPRINSAPLSQNNFDSIRVEDDYGNSLRNKRLNEVHNLQRIGNPPIIRRIVNESRSRSGSPDQKIFSQRISP